MRLIASLAELKGNLANAIFDRVNERLLAARLPPSRRRYAGRFLLRVIRAVTAWKKAPPTSKIAEVLARELRSLANLAIPQIDVLCGEIVPHLNSTPGIVEDMRVVVGDL